MQDFERELVDKVKMKIIKEGEKKPFSQTKLGIFLATDWWEVFADKFADKMAAMLHDKDQEKEPDEIENTVRPTYHLTSVFPTKEIQDEVLAILDRERREEIERYYKRMFSEYLGMSDEEVETLTWEEIDELVLSRFKNRFPSNVKYLLLSNKA